MPSRLIMVMVPIAILPLPGVTISLRMRTLVWSLGGSVSCHRLSMPAFVNGLIAAAVSPVQG
jgi:hypothetical protein